MHKNLIYGLNSIEHLIGTKIDIPIKDIKNMHFDG